MTPVAIGVNEGEGFAAAWVVTNSSSGAASYSSVHGKTGYVRYAQSTGYRIASTGAFSVDLPSPDNSAPVLAGGGLHDVRFLLAWTHDPLAGGSSWDNEVRAKMFSTTTYAPTPAPTPAPFALPPEGPVPTPPA